MWTILNLGKNLFSMTPPRGGKSAATWQPSCQKVFEESGSGRKFLDHSPALSLDLIIWY